MRNLTMMTDLYELTMMQGYFSEGMVTRRAVFDMFYRSQNSVTEHAVVAGIEQLVEYIQALHFTKDDIGYIASLNLFRADFLAMLADFRFTGDIDAVPEGSVVFPNEPIIRVNAPIMEAQVIETALLTIINHQTLIATKAARVVHAAQGDDVIEFGLRRAQGPDAGIYGARAAVIGGCVGTSNVIAGQMFDIPVKGTHAHSWVMSFPSELEAFEAYARQFPSTCLLLVDTYDTLKSGVPHAITVFNRLRDEGYTPVGIRLDSGDLAYLSREARAMLDSAGFTSAKIFASSDLDEEVIWDLKAQGAAIDVWGVGTRLITGGDCPALGGVYKVAALQDHNGVMQPKLKVSDNPAKVTNPGIKKLYRIYDKAGMAVADIIALEGEDIDFTRPLTLFDPINTWKQMTIEQYCARDLHAPLFRDGVCVHTPKSLAELRAYTRRELNTFWNAYKRLNNPHVYKVDLSSELFKLKSDMLNIRV